MEIIFCKMHGAGNDFIVVDDRSETFPVSDKKWISKISERRTGVGCEGIILLSQFTKKSARMRFFNPDGNLADFCGNGARCAARFASDFGSLGPKFQLITDAGAIDASVSGQNVTLSMPLPLDWRFNQSLQVGNSRLIFHFVKIGVPHAVVFVDEIETVDVIKTGSLLRNHEFFAPHGTNVNFIKVIDRSTLAIRTYERGVENETGACGSGAVASALIAAKLNIASLPAKLITHTGYTLEISAIVSEEKVESVFLTGPADYAFKGSIHYP